MKNKFLLPLVLGLFAISSCSFQAKLTDPGNRTYDDYEEFKLDKVENLYNKEGDYAVQFYYETCRHCKNLRGNLYDYLDAYKEGTKKSKVYIFDIKSSSSEEGINNRKFFKEKPSGISEENLINEMVRNHVSSLSETYFLGVPSLYIIENNKLKDFKIGTQTIANYYSVLK